MQIKSPEIHQPLTGEQRLLYRAPFCDIIVMGRFNCDIIEKPLKRALVNARLKYPLLGARIEQDKDGNAWFAFDNVPDFQVDIVNKKTENQWFELAWQEQQEPFDMGKGPLVKFLLLRSVESSDLVVICHHIICDGLSLAYLIKVIASFLQEPDANVEPMPLPPIVGNEDLAMKISPSWFYRIAIAWINRSWKKSKKVFSEEDYARVYQNYWKSKDIGMAMINLPKDITATFLHRCHEEHVTVNSALTTALAFSQYDMEGQNNKPYLKKALVAINIRDFFKKPAGENFRFLAGGVEVTLPDKTREFWNAARKFNVRMARLRSSPEKIMEGVAALNLVEPTLMDAVYFAAYGDFKNKTALNAKGLVLTKTGKPRRSLDITNIGLVSLDNSNLEKMFFIPIISSNYEKAIGIATAGGEMNIIMLHDLSQFSVASMEDFKQRILGYIK